MDAIHIFSFGFGNFKLIQNFCQQGTVILDILIDLAKKQIEKWSGIMGVKPRELAD